MSNEHASDREREQKTVEAIQHLSMEAAELVDLRGRVLVARAILARGGDRQDAINALDGGVPIVPVGLPHNEEA